MLMLELELQRHGTLVRYTKQLATLQYGDNKFFKYSHHGIVGRHACVRRLQQDPLISCCAMI